MVRVEEATQSRVTGADASDDQVSYHQRRRDCAVVVAIVRHLGIPDQGSAETVQCDDVCVVGHGEDEVVSDRDPSVQSDGGIADQAFGARLRVSPDLAPGRRIEGVHLIHARDIHHSSDDHRGTLEHWHIGNRVEPLSSELVDVVAVDLVDRAVTVRRVVAVVGIPVDVRFDRRLLEPVTLFAKEVKHSVGGAELGVEPALVKHRAREARAIGQGERSGTWAWRSRIPSRGAGCGDQAF